jgi:hypothetical protein
VSRLAESLGALRAGEAIIIAWSRRYGAERELRFTRGAWVESVRACYSDTCQCNSHDTYDTFEVSRQRALELIRDVIATDEADASRRAAETAWVDAQTAALSAPARGSRIRTRRVARGWTATRIGGAS